MEAAAVTEAVGYYLVAPSEDNVTVKINIAWCENDYQLDISLRAIPPASCLYYA